MYIIQVTFNLFLLFWLHSRCLLPCDEAQVNQYEKLLRLLESRILVLDTVVGVDWLIKALNFDAYQLIRHFACLFEAGMKNFLFFLHFSG